MDVISYSSLRKNLATTLEKVTNDRNPVIVTRQKGEAAVLISLKDFNAYEETAYLLSNPKNAARLKQSIQEAEQGNMKEHNLASE